MLCDYFPTDNNSESRPHDTQSAPKGHTPVTAQSVRLLCDRAVPLYLGGWFVHQAKFSEKINFGHKTRLCLFVAGWLPFGCHRLGFRTEGREG